MFEIEAVAEIDDLLELLARTGSFQDYPRREELEREHRRGTHHLDRRRGSSHNFRANFTDQRSLTRDAHLSEVPVPGYRDWPAGVVIDFRR
jgi:hypothetical protein